MTDRIAISQRLLQAISNGEWKGSGTKGFLLGPLHEPSTVLAVWKNDIPDLSIIKDEIDNCLMNFPCGKNVIGMIQVASSNLIPCLESGNKIDLEKDLVCKFGSVDALLDLFGKESVLLLYLYKPSKRGNSSGQEWEMTFVSVEKSSIKSKQVDSNSNMHSTGGMRMRLKANIPVVLSFSSNNDEEKAQKLNEHCVKLQNSIEDGMFVFGFDKNSVLLHKEGVCLGAGVKSWKLVKDIKKYLKDVSEQREDYVPSGKGIQKPIDVSILQFGSNASSSPSHAPIIAHRKDLFSSVQLSLPIDILVDVKEDTDVETLYCMLGKSVSRQLSALFKCLKSHSQSDQFSALQVFHFKPSGIESPVTIVYPKGVSEDDLEKERLHYHECLLLAKDRPYLRKACAGVFLGPTTPAGYLVNPHTGLNLPSPVKNGTVSLVDGCYSYHHYMQDRFNDDKWGCAYRSLQTIFSWFKYQGYTERTVPSHREIQQALYEIGDKEEKFVGSRQWIGSFEVSFVLDHLLNVTSKFINVSSGAELATTGQQLLNHFQTQETPIMIGGGVLAHTILGVAYDELTGNISFLILDPHYTGGEDLKLVQDKGWCGWKDMKFWNQTAHYNMCLPQRPIAI